MNEVVISAADFLDFADSLSYTLAENCVPDDVVRAIPVVVTLGTDGEGCLSASVPICGKKAGGKRVR